LPGTLETSAFGGGRKTGTPSIRTGHSVLTHCRRPAAHRHLVACAFAVSLGYAVAADAQSAENVAVVINDASPASRTVGEYYIGKRGIPPSNVIHISIPEDDDIDRRTYASAIEWPVRARFAQQGLQDRILYLVLTKGVPLQIVGTGGESGTFASVDAELAFAYRRMTGQQVSPIGPVDNPYFLGTKELSDARPFTHREHDLLLVTRLDGYSVEDALALVDRAATPERNGRIVFSTQTTPRTPLVNDWITNASLRLTKQGYREHMVIASSAAVPNERPLVGYFGSSPHMSTERLRAARFLPCAIVARAEPVNATTFRDPATTNRAGEAPVAPVNAGDLIRAGISGTVGFVGDPSGGTVVRPDILYPAYVAGFNLAESIYLAMPRLSRRTVVIGDPLCAPYRQHVLTRSEIEFPDHPVMELAGAFANRRLQFLRREYPHVPEGALMLADRASAYDRRGDLQTARRLLETTTALAPGFASAQAQLAVLYDRFEERDLAIDRYQRALDAQPPYVRGELMLIATSTGFMEVRQLAFNNLAYDLAVYRRAPEQALPLARKALAFGADHPELLDTIGWIEHLTGDDQSAMQYFRSAVARMPGNAAVWVHAAVVAATINARDEAEKYLATALQMDPSVASSQDAVAVRDILNAPR